MSGKRAAQAPVEIEAALSATDEVRTLVTELDEELSGLYKPEQRHGLSLHAIFQPHIRFFVARMNGLAVGCGGVALFDDFAELKRMYVRRATRGQGLADVLLTKLSAVAMDAGLAVLRLETGEHSDAAIRFYRRHGFKPCAVFEPYASMPRESIDTSVFLEKRLQNPLAVDINLDDVSRAQR